MKANSNTPDCFFFTRGMWDVFVMANMELAQELVNRAITEWTLEGCWRLKVPQDLAMRVQNVIKN